ncbi:RidA family protein [candidate division KSB1 bacterium]|nr:RidA family protein [candidate division KSB1 bacterium]
MKKIISTDKAPKAIGPYSQAVVLSGQKLVFVSGQIAMDPVSGEIIKGGITEQTKQVLKNVESVLQAAGSDLLHVIKTTVFLKNMNDFVAMNTVYESFFSSDPPARAAVEVARLPKDVLIEIEVIAELAG